MLIEFSASNYKSIGSNPKNPETISLATGKLRTKPNHTIDNRILKSAVIFGANASGKSNMIDAIRFVRNLILDNGSLSETDEQFYCKNIEKNQDEPSIFTFIIEVEPDNKDSALWIMEDQPYMKPDPNVYKYTIEFGFSKDLGPHIIGESLEKQMFDSDESILLFKIDSKLNNGEMNNREFMVEYQTIEKRIMEIKSMMENLKIAKTDLIKRHSSIVVEKTSLIELLREKLDSSDSDQERKDIEIKLDRTEMELDQEISTYEEKDEVALYDREIYKLKSELTKKEKELKDKTDRRNNIAHGLGGYFDFDIDKRFVSVPAILDTTQIPFELFTSKKCTKKMIKEAASEVRNWFKNNLEIIDPDDYVLDVTDSTNLDKLSEIVSGFDVGIKTIDWKRVDDQEEIDEVIRSSSTRDKSVIKEVLTSKTDGNIQTSCTVKIGKNIYQFISGRFGFVLNKLVTYHENGKCHSISEESDGTRRLIELSSILLPTNIHKTYLVDELDCRIHPLLVEHFIDLYFKDRFGSSDRKQLIFTTHEIGLLSTKMFRTDEIWFVDKDKNGCSNFHSAYEGSISYNAKLSDLYLTEQTLGGVPKFRNL